MRIYIDSDHTGMREAAESAGFQHLLSPWLPICHKRPFILISRIYEKRCQYKASVYSARYNRELAKRKSLADLIEYCYEWNQRERDYDLSVFWDRKRNTVEEF